MPESKPKPQDSNFKTIIFMVALSFSCALILSILASALAEPQETALRLDRSKQMMIAAKILDYNNHFLLKNADGKLILGKYSDGGVIVPGGDKDFASQSQILEVHKKRLIPMLVDSKGEMVSFEKAKINLESYLENNKKSGYHKQPLKLIYLIQPNGASIQKESTQQEKVEGYVIPVNGFGLWDAIYGYLALEPDGNTTKGITWYDQKETPGLGANIAEEPWQALFPGKVIFQESPGGETDFKTAPLGIVVVKGKVAEVLGSSPKAKSAVDGMAGATLTGNGVTDAYKEVLKEYRPFLMKVHEENTPKQRS